MHEEIAKKLTAEIGGILERAAKRNLVATWAIFPRVDGPNGLDACGVCNIEIAITPRPESQPWGGPDKKPFGAHFPKDASPDMPSPEVFSPATELGHIIATSLDALVRYRQQILEMGPMDPRAMDRLDRDIMRLADIAAAWATVAAGIKVSPTKAGGVA